MLSCLGVDLFHPVRRSSAECGRGAELVVAGWAFRLFPNRGGGLPRAVDLLAPSAASSAPCLRRTTGRSAAAAGRVFNICARRKRAAGSLPAARSCRATPGLYSSGYSPVAGGQCRKTEDLVPERPRCSYNNKAAVNPQCRQSYHSLHGLKNTQHRRFRDRRRSVPDESKLPKPPLRQFDDFQSISLGLAGGWVFDFAYELQLGAFSGSPSSPNATLSLIAPDGTGYDFTLLSNGQWVPNTASGAIYAPTDLKLEFVGTLPSNLATIRNSSTTWRLTDGDDNVRVFHTFPRPNTSTYAIGRPVSRTTRNGYVWTFAYTPMTAMGWSPRTYPSGHIVTYTRAADGKITAVSAKPSSSGTSTNIATSIGFGW